ncbi:hypothetical protein ACJX0J_027235, partial [Zea mays]
ILFFLLYYFFFVYLNLLNLHNSRFTFLKIDLETCQHALGIDPDPLVVLSGTCGVDIFYLQEAIIEVFLDFTAVCMART